MSLFVIGCEDDEVRTYDVNKAKPTTQQVATAQPPTEPPAAPMTPPAMPPNAAAPTATASPIPWTVPQAWERVPGDRPMRVATFRRPNVQGMEIVVSQFPGDVGGVLANVNRWRNQVGLQPIQEADLAKELRPFDNGKMKGHLMRLRGEKDHMLAAIISDPANDRTWFIKCTTNPLAADTTGGDFDAFAKSFGIGIGNANASGGAASPATQPATTHPLDNK